ncbi:MAG: D-glycero-beta-D-manno-heptose-7-phosphate kinase [Proteobacteria bacterium]|nr:D-glycero-beta-D-manno-heptose-7-phosphate kinase [Pseudomonadota bacterium]MCL2307262.1 D-glycero-beta-D-manno-heptose-7-phosphate kinase [Pseudomonadota bacterium]
METRIYHGIYHFADWKDKLTKARVLVVGDVMLDRYWFGDVDRISPEAPVPVVRVAREEARPGGAANVARNVASLGSQAVLLSVIGNDEAGKKLEALIQDEKVISSFQRDAQLPTTVKLRVIGRQQQLLRIDFETQPSHEALSGKLAEFKEQIRSTDVVLLSDYGKGGLRHITQMIASAAAAGKPVVVDPKGSDWEKYQGAFIITPNRSELQQVVGVWRDENDLAARVTQLRQTLKMAALLLTRSEEGMSLFTEEGVWHIPTRAREVYDVSGAGDTVVATLGVFLAAGAPLREAVYFANEAAGIVVGKFGTAVVTPEELG